MGAVFVIRPGSLSVPRPPVPHHRAAEQLKQSGRHVFERNYARQSPQAYIRIRDPVQMIEQDAELFLPHFVIVDLIRAERAHFKHYDTRDLIVKEGLQICRHVHSVRGSACQFPDIEPGRLRQHFPVYRGICVAVPHEQNIDRRMIFTRGVFPYGVDLGIRTEPFLQSEERDHEHHGKEHQPHYAV